MRSRLRPGEELITVVRRHAIALLLPVGALVFAVGACGAAFLAPQRGWRFVGAAALAVAAIWALWEYVTWRADLWAVTTQRVIDESGVLTTRMVDSPLETINNVACQQSLFGRMLGFGRVEVHTAADRAAIEIGGIADPEGLRDAILDMKERRRAGSPPAVR